VAKPPPGPLLSTGNVLSHTTAHGKGPSPATGLRPFAVRLCLNGTTTEPACSTSVLHHSCSEPHACSTLGAIRLTSRRQIHRYCSLRHTKSLSYPGFLTARNAILHRVQRHHRLRHNCCFPIRGKKHSASMSSRPTTVQPYRCTSVAAINTHTKTCSSSGSPYASRASPFDSICNARILSLSAPKCLAPPLRPPARRPTPQSPSSVRSAQIIHRILHSLHPPTAFHASSSTLTGNESSTLVPLTSRRAYLQRHYAAAPASCNLILPSRCPLRVGTPHTQSHAFQ
jgi:hypothetical protein